MNCCSRKDLTRSDGFEHTAAGQYVTALGQFSDASAVDSMVVVFTMDSKQLLHRMSKEVTVITS